MTKQRINKNGGKNSQTTTLITTEVESHSNREQHKLISFQSLDLNKYPISESIHQQNEDQEPKPIDINVVCGTVAASFPFPVNIDIHETEIGATNQRKEIPEVLLCDQVVLDEHHYNHISSCLIQKEPSCIVNNPVVEKCKSDSDLNKAKQQPITTADNFAILDKETKYLSSPQREDKCNRAFIGQDIFGAKPIDDKTNLSQTLLTAVDQIEIDLLYVDNNIQNMYKK